MEPYLADPRTNWQAFTNWEAFEAFRRERDAYFSNPQPDEIPEWRLVEMTRDRPLDLNALEELRTKLANTLGLLDNEVDHLANTSDNSTFYERLRDILAELPNVATDATTQRLYVMQQGGSDGPVKIGVSHDPRKRLASIRTSNPYRVVLRREYVDGWMERHLHRIFADARLEGEWFECVPQIRVLFNL